MLDPIDADDNNNENVTDFFNFTYNGDDLSPMKLYTNYRLAIIVLNCGLCETNKIILFLLM